MLNWLQVEPEDLQETAEKKTRRRAFVAALLVQTLKCQVGPHKEELSCFSYIVFFSLVTPVLGIRDILVRIRIRLSVPLTNGSGSDSFLQ
jgi:hypothetical protein